jgi:metal-dependent amidase/aminoacylase/carboxypeptidase family protein
MRLEVTRNAGGTSVVTTMDSGKPSKTVALRAELDTLSSLEKTHIL